MNQPTSIPTNPPRLHAAIDIGTSSIKCIAIDSATPGDVHIVGSAPTPISRPGHGLVEVDPLGVFEACAALLTSLFDLANQTHRPVASIGLTGFVGSAICLDNHGDPMKPCTIWQDQRCAPQTDEFFNWARERIRAIHGVDLPRGVCWPGPKIRWLRENRPDVLAHTWKIVQIKDYVFLKLTGMACSEARTFIGLANIVESRFDSEVLEWCGVRRDQLPELRQANETFDMIATWGSRFSSYKFPLPRIGIGTADMTAAFIGCLLEPGEGVLLANTSEIMGFVVTSDEFSKSVTISGWPGSRSSEPPGSSPDGSESPEKQETRQIPGARKTSTPATQVQNPSVNSAPGVIRISYRPGLDLIYGSTTNGAACVDWFQRVFGPVDLAAIGAESEAIPPGCDGLLFLPYLIGERAPIWDERATGAFFGIRASHTKAHMYRAILEGCSFSKRHVLESAGAGHDSEARDGGRISAVVVCGGTSRIPLWNKIRASVLGLPIQVDACAESSALGALSLGAEQTDPQLSMRYRQTRERTLQSPIPEWVDAYDRAYGRYLELSALGAKLWSR